MTNETKHTKEPWCIGPDGGLWSERGPLSTDSDPANARRIVACVNACAGISTEVLETAQDCEMHAALIRLRTYKAQRDELAEALRIIAGPENNPTFSDAANVARAALAKLPS